MGDVFAGEGIEEERILDGAATGLLAVDLGEGEDLADVCAGVEAPRHQALVIRRRLDRERQELREQALLAGAVALLEQRLGVIRIFDVLVPIEASERAGR